MRDPIAQSLGHDFGVLREPISTFPVQPTTFLEDFGGEIPVVQRDPRRDVVREQGVDQSVVEREPFLVDSTSAVGKNPGPGQRQAVGLETNLTHERDVFFEAVVVVTRHSATVTLLHGIRTVAIIIPDTRLPPSLTGGTFDLIRGRGSAPHKIVFEWHAKSPKSLRMKGHTVTTCCGLSSS